MEKEDLKLKAKAMLKDVQRRIQGREKYGELQALNQIVEFWNENIEYISLNEKTHFWIDFYALMQSIRLISVNYQTGHWNQVISSRIGSFLTNYEKIQ